MDSVGYEVISRSFTGDVEDLKAELRAEAAELGFKDSVERDELYWTFRFGTCTARVTVTSALPPNFPAR